MRQFENRNCQNEKERTPRCAFEPPKHISKEFLFPTQNLTSLANDKVLKILMFETPAALQCTGILLFLTLDIVHQNVFCQFL